MIVPNNITEQQDLRILNSIKDRNFKYSSDLLDFCLAAGFSLDKAYEINDIIFNNKVVFRDNEENICRYVTTYKYACKILNVLPLTINDFKFLPIEEQKVLFAEHQLKRIIKTLNQGWIKDWTNPDEYYYIPYFNMKGAFSYCNYLNWDTFSDVGLGWGFKNEELLEYCVNQFIDLYKDYYLG